MPNEMQRKYKVVLLRAALVFLGVGVGFFFVETAFRIAPSLLPDIIQNVTRRGTEATYMDQMCRTIVADRELLARLKPGVDVQVDAHPEFSYRIKTVPLTSPDTGFRDDGITGEPFAIVVGDSFTFGHGVDMRDGFVELLESSTGLDFANLGVFAYGSRQETEVLRRYGIPLRPKLVLLCFYVNDIADNVFFEKRVAQLARESRHPILSALRSFLHEHCISYELLKYALRVGVYGTRASRGQKAHPPLEYNSGPLRLRFDLKLSWCGPKLLENPTNRRGWTLTEESIRDAHAMCEKAAARLVVVLIPFKEQVYWPIIKQKWPNVADQRDPDAAYVLVKKLCQRESIPVCDLAPVFKQQAGLRKQLYFRTDVHWNVAGHMLAAQTIKEFLVANHCVPALAKRP